MRLDQRTVTVAMAKTPADCPVKSEQENRDIAVLRAVGTICVAFVSIYYAARRTQSQRLGKRTM